MRKISNKGKKNFKKVLYVGLYIVIISWMVVSGIQLWLDCAILDNNYSNMLVDKHDDSITEVADVYSNGDFTLSGDGTVLKSDSDVNNYVRVPSYGSYYYNKENKSFFAPLTKVETRNLMLKFVLLDMLSFIIMIVLLVHNRNKGTWLKVIIWVSEILYAFVTYLIYANALSVLYRVEKGVWIIPLVKLVILCIVLLIAFIVDARKDTKLPLRLHRRKKDD